MGKNQFVVKHSDEQSVIGANNKRATRVVDTQKKAISIARNIAINQQSEMRVQDQHGKWRVCNSYGKDTCPPKDKNY